MSEKEKRETKQQVAVDLYQDDDTIRRVAIGLYAKYWNDSFEVADTCLKVDNGRREAWERVARYAVEELAGETVKPENAENAAGKVSASATTWADGEIWLEEIQRLREGMDSARERIETAIHFVATVVPR